MYFSLGLFFSKRVARPRAYAVFLSPYLPPNRGRTDMGTSNTAVAAEDRLRPIVQAYPKEVRFWDHRDTLGLCAKLAISNRVFL